MTTWGYQVPERRQWLGCSLRVGLWLETSTLTADETVDRIEASLDEAPSKHDRESGPLTDKRLSQRAMPA
jgi:hypothetical protein